MILALSKQEGISLEDIQHVLITGGLESSMGGDAAQIADLKSCGVIDKKGYNTNLQSIE